MKRVVIVHGWKGNPEGNWFPWMEGQLTTKGFDVRIPVMPTPGEPQQDEWVEAIRAAAEPVNDQLLLVGHSLGCIAVLRFLEALPKDVKVAGTLLVAGFAEPLGKGYETHAPFFTSSLPWEKIKMHCPHFVVMESDNDPHVPKPLTESLAKNLAAQLITIPGAGHFRDKDGFESFPKGLEALLSLATR